MHDLADSIVGIVVVAVAVVGAAHVVEAEEAHAVVDIDFAGPDNGSVVVVAAVEPLVAVVAAVAGMAKAEEVVVKTAEWVAVVVGDKHLVVGLTKEEVEVVVVVEKRLVAQVEVVAAAVVADSRVPVFALVVADIDIETERSSCTPY